MTVLLRLTTTQTNNTTMKPETYNTYAVNIEVRSGDFEKHTTTLIHAPDSEKAWHFACYAESHYPEELQWDSDGRCNEPDWSFAYRVDGVDKVPDDEVPVLRKHLNCMTYDADVLAKCGNYLEEMI